MAGTLTLHDQDRGGEWDALIGQTVGSYRIVRLLGRGGMGAVYLARQPAIGALVAIKFLHPRFSADRSVVERFFNEARAVNLIGHENILKILDFAVTPEGRYYFVMEYLDGRPLSSLTAAKQPVALEVAGPILLQCCRALAAAHGRGITHRDLKPDNIFLVQQMGRKNFVKLVDFGIAKLEALEFAREGGLGLTQAGTVIGTPEYMSPEQAAGRTSEVGKRSDVYSLGIVMYQLACGRVPFSGESTAQTLVAQMQEAPPMPRTVAPSVPEALELVILKALAKKREDRFQSMQELYAALLAAMQSLGISPELPVADEPAPQPPAPPQLPPPGTPDAQIETLAGPPPPPSGAPPRLSAREIDPRFATQAPPPTQTRIGSDASPGEQAGRVIDWLIAPARRARTIAGAAAIVAALIFVTRARSPEPAPKPPATTPVAAAPRPAPPTSQPPRAPEPPKLLPPSPAQVALAQQEKGKHHAPPPNGEPRAEPKPKAGASGASQPTARPAPAAASGAKPALPAPAKVAAAPLPKPAPSPALKPAPVPAPLSPPMPLTAAEAAKATAAAAPARPARAGGKSETEQEAARLARATQEMTDACAGTLKEEAALPALPRSAKLYLVSDPLGASVTAAWSGKSAAGEAPVVFKVLRGARVTLTFSKAGYAPAVREVAAGATQVVVTQLKKEP